MNDTEIFLHAETIEERARALTRLVKSKEVHSLSRDAAFKETLSFLAVSAAGNSGVPRLLAVSTLVKLATVVRTTKESVASVLSIALTNPLPPLQSLLEADDRYYLAGFWRFTAPTWTPTYLANSMVMEESAENTRRELAEGLLTVSISVSEALNLVSEAASNLKFQTIAPSTSMFRRLRRIVAALRDAIQTASNKNLGEHLGERLRDLLRRAGYGKDTRITEELASEVVSIISTIVRFRLSSAIDSEIYAALFTVKDWFDAVDWTRFIKRSDTLAIASDIADALEIGLRSGSPNREMLNVYRLLHESQPSFDEAVEALAQRIPGLSEELCAWLTGKQPLVRKPLAAESQAARMETALADVFLNFDEMLVLVAVISSDLIPELSMFSSLPVAPLKALTQTIRRANLEVNEIASSRGFTKFGTPGEIVTFSPLAHEVAPGHDIGGSRLRVIRSGVYVDVQGSRSIIKKAILASE